jgi:dolichol-phosphate mannosyltransferase
MGLFAILSIIIKYLQLAVGLLIKQKDYNFESIEKVTRQ